ncbi:MAG TPA: hypothetical protein VG826_02475 [Pirellulales bacterium]|nr:hypothetical protein [Pirellulales bacterium]
MGFAKATSAVRAVAFLALASFSPAACPAETVVDSDFFKGGFASLGWKAEGAWDIFRYPSDPSKNPGPVARFAANKPGGSLTRRFVRLDNPHELTLSLEYGWGWGDVDQGADAVSFMLLDDKGDGYVFEVHRHKAPWAVQWGKVAAGVPAKEKTWASQEIDATTKSIHDGGALSRLTVSRRRHGDWRITGADWNQGAGATVLFTDGTTTSFSQLVLLGTENFDEQVFNKIVLSVLPRGEDATTAVAASDFLASVGIVTTFPDRGQPLDKTIEMVKYAGFRWIRGGIEGLTTDGPTTLQTYLNLHRQTGARFSWGLVSGGTDLKKLIDTARPLAEAGALLAFEGNNEPNNWGVTYQGEPGGGRAPSWLAVARLQRDLYAAVKNDPLLKKYPVWSISEGGAEIDNVGLQFLSIPTGADTTMPAGTKYADYANVHNYIYHPNSSGLEDNKTWNAAEPTSACKVDGLYGNYGVTWAKHFRGYSEADLLTLPRVTTETGCTIDGPITEEIQALNLLTMYLDQFKRGWSHTAVYLLRDRTDEGGNQSFGFFKPDYTPRKAAVYLHNLTAILADEGSPAGLGRLKYSFSHQPVTMHELLLQKRDGKFELVVWNERLEGADEVTVDLGGRRSGVKVYDPTIGTDPVQSSGPTDRLALTLSNHPLVIEVERE